MKKIPIGVDNFKRLIDDDYYYVDKTLLIKEIIDLSSIVTLITRPRRFGKTLNMSMLQYFFEIPKIEGFEDTSYLFKDLNIWKEKNREYRAEQGVYPLIYLSLKTAKQLTWESTYYNLVGEISYEYQRHKYLLDDNGCLTDEEKYTFKQIMNRKGTHGEYTDCLLQLSKHLYDYHKKEVVIIIDEYDTPLQAGHCKGYFEKILDFTKSFLVKGFKDNKYLKRGILTGIMKIAKESTFSDFNNPVIATVLDEDFQDKFGFTEEEVVALVKHRQVDEEMTKIKEWYNGYLFGNDTVIYNPWSIINYVARPSNGFNPYWVNTGGRELIKQTLMLNEVESKKTMEKLIKNEPVRKEVSNDIVYQQVTSNFAAAWGFLIHTGYLKISNKSYDGETIVGDLSIPNREVRMTYRTMLREYFQSDLKQGNAITAMIKHLVNGKIDKFERALQSIYLGLVSYYDVATSNKTINIDELDELGQDTQFENFHHGFILGLLMFATDYYQIQSNREYGLGRPDLVLLPNDKSKPAYILELKWASTQEKISLDSLLNKGIKQISDKKYVEGVIATHNPCEVISIAIAFKGKEVKMKIIKGE